MSEELLNALEKFLPPYLVDPSRENLRQTISKQFPSFNESKDVYSLKGDSRLLQGDCLDEIPFFIIENNGEKPSPAILYYAGIVLSNSCSLDQSNARLEQSSINFAQVYELSTYNEFLKQKGLDIQKIENHLKDLKANSISGIIYLPELRSGEQNKVVFPESIVRLDKVTTVPQSILKQYNLDYKPIGDKFFTLSNYGFYVFLFKLSVHLCRFSEKIDRDQ